MGLLGERGRRHVHGRLEAVSGVRGLLKLVLLLGGGAAQHDVLEGGRGVAGAQGSVVDGRAQKQHLPNNGDRDR